MLTSSDFRSSSLQILGHNRIIQIPNRKLKILNGILIFEKLISWWKFATILIDKTS